MASKTDQALTKATEEALAAGSLSLVDAGSLGSMIADDGWETAPQVVSLDVGHMVEGELIGPGTPVDYTRPDGDEDQLATWAIRLDNRATIALISSHQLNKEFPGLVGKRIRVVKLPQKSVGSKRVNQFLIQSREIREPKGAKR